MTARPTAAQVDKAGMILDMILRILNMPPRGAYLSPDATHSRARDVLNEQAITMIAQALGEARREERESGDRRRRELLTGLWCVTKAHGGTVRIGPSIMREFDMATAEVQSYTDLQSGDYIVRATTRALIDAEEP